MGEPVARRVTVRGRVQGVFFRDSTRDAASAAGVHGWIRNNSDGTVLAHLEGASAAVEEVIAFVRQGPDAAAVHAVDVEDVRPEGLTGFEVR